MKPRTFKESFCATTGCREDRFATTVFWRCLRKRAVPFAWVIATVHPGFFAADRKLIQAVGGASTRREFEEELNYHLVGARSGTFMRGALSLRVSVRRLCALFGRYHPERAGATAPLIPVGPGARLAPEQAPS